MTHWLGEDALWRPLKRINLNGLYALDAILNTASLTEAGQAIALGQPAMSMALRRLREHFDDDLVIYEGGRRQPTVLALALAPRIRRLLREADAMFHLELDFDPATDTRSILLAAPEPIEIMVLSHLVPAMLMDAPGIQVHLLPIDYRAPGRMWEQGVDLAVVPEMLVDPTLSSRPLLDLGVTGMVWSGHRLAGRAWSIEDYLRARHVALFEHIERNEFDAARDPVLAARHIAVRTGRYSMLPRLVIGTDLIVTTTNWLAQYHAAMLPLSLISIPVEPQISQVVAQWQPHRDRDPMIHWLCERLKQTLTRFGPTGNRWQST